MESFAFNIAEGVLWKLGSHTIQEIGIAFSVNTELRNLQETLETVRSVLLDAEERQEKDHELRVWLRRLEVVCRAADDVLDEFEILALQRRLMPRWRQVSGFFLSFGHFAFNHRMAHKINEIRERLSRVADDKVKFHLTERVVVNREVVQREAYAVLNTAGAIGRNQDKEKIIDMLMTRSGHETVGVIPIVGIGGLGKTTLARMVYNDERVIENFQLRIWLDGFNAQKLIGKIIRTGSNSRDDSELDAEELLSRLRGTLEGKRYLLVLDDVCIDNRIKWVELYGLLEGGANGSTTIVTTRDELVAKIVNVPPYHLDGLSHEEALSLFVRWAFDEGEEVQYRDLMRIGEEIVRKCSGVPLAIRTLASQLYLKRSEHDWLFVRDNEIWRLDQTEDSIIPALRLSYDKLPSHLKQCFAYCSNFPKNHEFDNINLIYQWIAQGLIQSPHQRQDLERIGEQYIQDLRLRSFFHGHEDYGYFFKFKMHELMHELAFSVATDFHAGSNPRKDDDTSFLDSRIFSEEAVSGISKFKRLRVLDLRHSQFEALPSSIDKLKHLRFLDLCFNKSIKSLPNSLCKLLLLQTLKLQGCESLAKLPKGFGNLMSLRCLWLTTQGRYLPSTQIRSLTSLRFLLIKGCRNLEHLFDDGDSVGMLQGLTAMQTLFIGDCERLKSLPLGLRCLSALENLVIANCDVLDLGLTEVIYQDGRGLTNLRYLAIRRVPKLLTMPRWVDGSASSLKLLAIEHCNNFTTLPQDLTSLHKLRIGSCSRLRSLPDGMSTLQEVHVDECPILIENCQRGTGVDWHKISHVPDIFFDGINIQQSVAEQL